MKSLRPYLARAVYEWIVDNDETPYLLVNAEYTDVIVPQAHVADGKIILNIGPSAVQGLRMGNDSIEFNARFSGNSMELFIPLGAALAIYAKESGKGMVFEEEGPEEPEPTDDKKSTEKPTLRVVK